MGKVSVDGKDIEVDDAVEAEFKKRASYGNDLAKLQSDIGGMDIFQAKQALEKVKSLPSDFSTEKYNEMIEETNRLRELQGKVSNIGKSKVDLLIAENQKLMAQITQQNLTIPKDFNAEQWRKDRARDAYEVRSAKVNERIQKILTDESAMLEKDGKGKIELNPAFINWREIDGLDIDAANFDEKLSNSLMKSYESQITYEGKILQERRLPSDEGGFQTGPGGIDFNRPPDDGSPDFNRGRVGNF